MPGSYRRQCLVLMANPGKFAVGRVALVQIYNDLPSESVDSSVIAAAERLSISLVATLDRRHFNAVRPNHVSA